MTHIWSNAEIKSFKFLFSRISNNLHSEEDYREARVIAKLLTEIEPGDSQTWYFLGVLNRALGDYDEAKGHLFRSLELGGEEFSNYVQLALIEMKRGEFKEAIQWGYKALKCNQKDVNIYHIIADLHVFEGDVVKAIKLLESSLKKITQEPESQYGILVKLGDLCLAINQIKKALHHFQSALRLNPSDKTLWPNIGHCHSQLGNYKDALKSFNKAVDSNPTPSNLYNLGDNYLAMNTPEKAIDPLIEATRKDPGYSLAHYDLSLGFFKMKKYQEGASAAIAALRPDPEMKLQRTNLGMGAMNNLGLCYMNLGRYEEALESFKRNVRLLDTTYFNIGLTFFRMKKYLEALEHFKKALDISPGDPEYLNLIGQTYSELGKHKIGEKYLRKSLKINPKYALGYYDLGVILNKFKTKRKEVLKLFLTAIELNPNMEWAYYSVACLYALSGDKKKALAYLKQALEKGLSDNKYIELDSDMDSLREEDEFKRLITEFFPVD